MKINKVAKMVLPRYIALYIALMCQAKMPSCILGTVKIEI
jgi:hypothetical protein